MNARPALPRNLVEHLQTLALDRPGDIAIIEVAHQAETVLDYAGLAVRVRALAAELQKHFEPGERALILLDNDIHYVVSFFACLYAGLIAVPVFPPESTREQHLSRLIAIAADSGADCYLVTAAIHDVLKAAAVQISPGARFITVDTIDPEQQSAWRRHCPEDADIAFLQYTSGSTGIPKGVMVSHGNLMANERAIEEGLSVRADDVFVSWLPLYHDMGLIGGLLQPIHRGIPVALLTPRFFLERPLRWLEAVSRYRGTISGGPDFAYRLCAERISDEQLKHLDLSSWRIAFSGAEPVRHETLTAFGNRFGQAGFSVDAVYPCYGLAEATLFVTGGKRGAGLTANAFSQEALAQGRVMPDEDGSILVGCGFVPSRHQVNIVDPEQSTSLPENRVGEIWTSGPSIGQGYWKRTRESDECFVRREGQRWLRTGDLGFRYENQLYIAGRLKDLIIIRGQNIYPQDIERAIEAEVDVVRKGRIAAFSVEGSEGEGIGIAVEVSRSVQKLVPADTLVMALSEAVAAVCHEPLSVAVLLNPGGLPKTSSGKLQRSACRKGWIDRTLDAYAIFEFGHFVLGGPVARHAEPLQDEIEVELGKIWQTVLKRGASGCDAMGRDANFFACGGNSLAAVQVGARIGDRWEIDFPVRVLFERPTLQACAAEIRRMLAAGIHKHKIVISARSEEDRRAAPAVLSYAQQRQWFLWRLEPESTAYHIAGALRLEGALDVEALRASFARIVERHETLRTVFRAGEDGLGEQVIEPVQGEGEEGREGVDIPVLDLRQSPAGEREARAMEEAQRVNATPFDLTRGPLLRVKLLRMDEDQHILIVVMHHIVSDGWSMQIIVDEFVSLYRARIQGQAAALPPLPIQYTDYAVWQRNWLEAGEKERQLAYWQRQLGDEHPVLALPTDHPRHALANYHAARHTFNLSDELPNELPGDLGTLLKQAAQARGATLFMVLLAGFQVLLYRYTGQPDIRVGVPIANRNRVETEGVVGFFVNTQVLRNRLHSRMVLSEVLDQAARASLDAQSHQDLPFEQLVEALHPERSLSHSPLFQVMHNHHHGDDSVLEQLPGLSLSTYSLGEQGAQFELTLDTQEHPGGEISVCFTYAAELFEAETIVRLGTHYLRILQGFAHHPEKAVGEIELLDAGEHERLRNWGRNERRYAAAEPVHWLIEQQVRQRPDAVALIFGEEELSYGELNLRANRLAHRLIERGVGPDVRVGIALERSVEMIVGLLGILKAGGAYVPLDPAYPAERLAYMVADSGIFLLLTQAGVGEGIPRPEGLAVMEVEEGEEGQGGSEAAGHDPQVALHGEHLAYVIYTSGSTGKPKGVGIPHHALVEHMQGAVDYLELTPADRMLQLSTVNFDAFAEQLYPPLCAGATVVLSGPALWDSETFYRELIDRHISVADLTTAYWLLLVQDFAARGQRDYGALRRVHVGGEAMPAEGIRAWREAGLGQVELFNLYGPTEAVVTASVSDCTALGEAEGELAQVAIGTPLAGRSIHILDGDLNPVGQGVAGELCIGGALLARGYLNRAGLTSERFVADPFDGTGGRLYRTGDLARWRSDGQIEYLGRLDHQVKVRGFRIELGEIEAQLLGQAGVREAVVVTQEGPGGTRLVGYVTPDGAGAAGAEGAAGTGEVLDALELKGRLSEVLPDYMVPSALVVLECLPLNPNGKIDRSALPDPEWTGSGSGDYEAPQGEVEAALAAIWAEVLGIERVGRQDNFFELGGHSLAAMQITALLAQRHGHELPIRHLFEYHTLEALASTLPASNPKGLDPKQQRLTEMDLLMSEFEV